MGAFVISPLPPFSLEDLRAAGSLGSTGVTPLHSYFEPSRHPRVFGRLPGGYRLYDLPCSTDFAVGRGGLLQLLDTASSPCCRSYPAGVTNRISQPATSHAAFVLRERTRPPELSTSRGHLCVHFRYGPVTRSPPWKMALSMGFRPLAFPPVCHPSYWVS